MNEALAGYCDKHNIEFDKSKSVRLPNVGTSVRCKYFKGTPTEGNEEIEDVEDDLFPF